MSEVVFEKTVPSFQPPVNLYKATGVETVQDLEKIFSHVSLPCSIAFNGSESRKIFTTRMEIISFIHGFMVAKGE